MVIGRRPFIPAAAIIASIGSNATRTAPSERRAVGRRHPVQMLLELDSPPPKPGRLRTATRVMLGADQEARI